MPEIAEVRINVELIKPLVQNKQIINIEFPTSSRYAFNKPEGFDLFKNNPNQTIQDINAKGKFIYWTLSNNWVIFQSLAMTGQLSPIKGKHPSFSLSYQDLNEVKYIYFNDPRHFGSIKFTNQKELSQKLKELGWDPFRNKLEDYKNFLIKKITKSNKCIASILLDQSIFAGVGNYLRSEILYDVNISPWKTGKSLSEEDILKICHSTIKIAQDAYDHQGATLLTYKDPYGSEGKYSSQFKVYSQKTDPHGNKIVKQTTLEKRSIFWVPDLQK